MKTVETPMGKGLGRAVLLGLGCTVVKSPCEGLEGASGIIRRETKNTLWLEGPGGKRRIVPKAVCTFALEKGGVPLGRIDGKDICSRPEDRMKKS